ncbi:MAG: SDR family oxidoreductase [Proteobacteria bacterium]|nr:SDR family oxidoreductase [Pseudomonadota bacterium]
MAPPVSRRLVGSELASGMDLHGKTAVITGASRGIGAGLAEGFAARGMKLALCARSASTLPKGADGITDQVDVAREADVRRFASAAERKLGTLDLWINNAGVLGPIAPLREIPADQFLAHLQVNIMGVVHGSRAYIDYVRSSGHSGVLINISSGAAQNGYAGWAPYCASKAAVDRISEAIQLEEGDHLRVHSIAPGIVDTDMQALIRSTPEDKFPALGKFLDIKKQDAFNSVPFVAEHILRCAFDPEARPDDVVVRLPFEKSA